MRVKLSIFARAKNELLRPAATDARKQDMPNSTDSRAEGLGILADTPTSIPRPTYHLDSCEATT